MYLVINAQECQKQSCVYECKYLNINRRDERKNVRFNKLLRENRLADKKMPINLFFPPFPKITVLVEHPKYVKFSQSHQKKAILV
jgi:hypothetical protein